MRKGFIIIISFFVSISGFGQYPLTTPNYTQDFNTLANTGISSTLPLGWVFSESGSNADLLYTAGTGSSTTGDTYSFGSAASMDRAFGGLQSGTLVPTIGFHVTNNTASSITSIQISYTGEQWRLGALARIDRLDFQYSLNASSLTTGTWVDVDALDFTAPVQAGAVGALDGNAPLNKTFVLSIITNLNIANGTSFFLRWNDHNATSSDDGLSLDDFTITVISSIPTSTDFYRSRISGDWDNILTWEVSADGSEPYAPALTPPDLNANTISIQTGHTVTITTSAVADQIIVETGAHLVNNTSSPHIFTLANGTGDDLDILYGGIYQVITSQDYTSSFSMNSGATVRTRYGGTIQIGNGSTVGGGNTAYGSTTASFIWEDSSVFEWNSSTLFATANVTFFPDVNPTTIPIFRTTNPTNIPVGGGTGSNTIVNGIFEANGPGTVIWQFAGTKTFRNGIRGSGNIDGQIGVQPSGKFIINGETAELGGSGSLILPTGNILEIGSVGGTTVTLISNKTVTGTITMLSTNTYIDVGTDTLTVTGNLNGGSVSSYVRTASTGRLRINNVGVTLREFPIGHSQYNPLKIENGNGHDWIVSVYDSITADPPQGITGAVQVTWDIKPSVNPPISGADITFQFDSTNQVGGDFNIPPYNTEPIQAWHRRDTFYWLAAGVPAPIVTEPLNVNRCNVKILNLTEFCPYALARISLPLPIKLIAFDVTRISSTHSYITWELAACCSKDAIFEIERSTDNRYYSFLASIGGSETNRFYNYHDTRLEKGITYYRLKMIDVDGKISYSKVIAVINDTKGLLLTSIAPNPVHHTAVVTLSSAKNDNVHFAIYNMAGVIVKQWSSAVQEGNNAVSIHTDKLAGGVYHLVAVSATGRSVLRFVKQ